MTALAWAPNLTGSEILEAEGWEHTRLGMPLADHLAAKRVSGRAETTLRDRRVYVGAFALMWPNLELVDVDSRHVLHYLSELQKRGLAIATLRIRYTHLNDFFEWCVDWDLIERNPMRRIDTPKRAGRRVYDIFTTTETKALEALPLIDGALLSIMLRAGLRKSECANLRVRDIRDGEIIVLDGKGGKDRTVPMGAKLSRAVALLRQDAMLGERDYLWYRRVNQGRTIKRERSIGDGSQTRWWERVLRDAGVRYRNMHMTRHTFATNWLRKGGRLETLSLAMGHESIATTKDLYGHLDTTDVFRDLAIMEALEE